MTRPFSMLTPPVYFSLDHAWPHVLRNILSAGREVSPRGMKTRELLHASFTLDNAAYNLLENPMRKLSYPYAVAEWLWILLGRNDVRTIAPYNKNIARYSDDGKTFFGAYGPWVDWQLDYVVDAIKNDKDTRQAVITIWQPRPVVRRLSDRP